MRYPRCYSCKNHPKVSCLCWLLDSCPPHRRFCLPAGHMTLVIGPRSRSWPTCWRNCPNSTAACLILATSGSLQSTYPRIWHAVKRGQTGGRNLHRLQKRRQRWPQRHRNESNVLCVWLLSVWPSLHLEYFYLVQSLFLWAASL